MNKKKRIAILFAVIIILAVGIIIAVASHQKKEMDFDKFADRFEKSAEEVLGEDVKKVSKTELAATLTYSYISTHPHFLHNLPGTPADAGMIPPIRTTFTFRLRLWGYGD